ARVAARTRIAARRGVELQRATPSSVRSHRTVGRLRLRVRFTSRGRRETRSEVLRDCARALRRHRGSHDSRRRPLLRRRRRRACRGHHAGAVRRRRSLSRRRLLPREIARRIGVRDRTPDRRKRRVASHLALDWRMLPSRMRLVPAAVLVSVVVVVPAWLVAQRGRGAGNPFPGGANPDGSLRPTRPVTQLFTQDAYTEYAILAPGSEQFRIRFLPEESRVGATELVNATRGGSEGSDIEVYDPRTGKPLKFTYQEEGADTHAIHAQLPIPVAPGGVGRVLIYKTYKDPRTYMMHGDDIVWVRSLSGYRLGVLLPKGVAVIPSNVAAQLTTSADGRLKLTFANPSGQSNPVTIHARKTTATFPPRNDADMFFDDVKTLYDLDAPETGRVKVEQIYSDYRKGDRAKLDSLVYIPLRDLKVVDLDTAKTLAPMKEGSA